MVGDMSNAAQTLELGTTIWVSAYNNPHLLGDVVWKKLDEWNTEHPDLVAQIMACEIDPELSDTAVMSEHYSIPMEASVNCVLVAGKREGIERTAAVAVRASTRADINGTIKRMLDVRKASFVPMDRAVEESTMEYGGITPIGLPDTWRFVVDGSINQESWIVIGSGIRASKIALQGSTLVALTHAQVIEGLGQ